MKQTQRDIKYIIKRILIGVGITIVLFNLKKCNVYALSTDYYIYAGANTGPSYNSVVFSSQQSSGRFVANYTSNNVNFHFYRYTNNDYFNSVIFYIFEYNQEYYLYATYYDTRYNGSYYQNLQGNWFSNLAYNKVQPTTNFLYWPNINAYDSSNNELFNYNVLWNNNGSALGKPSTSFDNYFYKIDLENFTMSKSNDRQLSLNIQTNGTLVYTSENVPLYVNNVEHVIASDPLADYTQVDLTGYQAVLLVPKNYQTMLSDSSHTNEAPPGTFRTYLDLEYYSQYCTRSTLLNVENTQDIMLNNIGVGTGNISETITGTCYEEPTQSIMSYEFDQYSGLKARGLLIYNAEQNWSGGLNPNEQESPFYGTSYVWYNPNLYNAYLVQSFESFNANIQYKDYSGEDKEVNVESLPTFNEAMENAIENVDSPTQLDTNKAKLTALFEFIKIPIVFIKKLSTNNCSPVTLPLPHTGQNITLQCMSSSVYNRYLPGALTSVLSIIINGLLIYRCTLTNIDIFTNILDPVDNKLEAIDL